MNCPNCNSDELKPYKNYMCCYSCGELITNKTNTMTTIKKIIGITILVIFFGSVITYTCLGFNASGDPWWYGLLVWGGSAFITALVVWAIFLVIDNE